MRTILICCLVLIVSTLRLERIHEGSTNFLDGMGGLSAFNFGTCGTYGYKREANIVVKNFLVRQDLTFDAQYMDSGQSAHNRLESRKSKLGGLRQTIYINGKPLTQNPDRGLWAYTKKSSGATGSTGILSFINNQQKIVIYYQNPWSGWPGAGVCIVPLNTAVDSTLYQKMYQAMLKYAKSESNSSQTTAGLYDNCIYHQDVNAGKPNFDQSFTGKLSNLKIQTRLKYSYDGCCYILNFDVAIRPV